MWMIEHPEADSYHSFRGPTTVVVTGTQGRDEGLIAYNVICAHEGSIWFASLTDNLKSRWEADVHMKRIV